MSGLLQREEWLNVGMGDKVEGRVAMWRRGWLSGEGWVAMWRTKRRAMGG